MSAELARYYGYGTVRRRHRYSPEPRVGGIVGSNCWNCYRSVEVLSVTPISKSFPKIPTEPLQSLLTSGKLADMYWVEAWTKFASWKLEVAAR